MNGNKEYDLAYKKRINEIVDNNQVLKGFNAFISDKSIATRYTYLTYVRNFLNYTNKIVEALNVDDFSEYLLYIKEDDNGNLTTSSYRIAVYSALKKYGKYLVASDKLDKNPMDFIDRPKALETQNTKEKRENGYLSKSEIKKYVQNISTGCGKKHHTTEYIERDMAIIGVFLNTGLRCSALMKLDVNDINFDDKTISVIEKGGKFRTYALADSTISYIQSWIQKRTSILNGVNCDALFINRKCQRLTQSGISKLVTKYADCIQGKHISPHKLRATYGTQLYNETKDIYFVQECMGHNNPKTTELYIRGNGNKRTKTASDIMSKLL